MTHKTVLNVYILLVTLYNASLSDTDMDCPLDDRCFYTLSNSLGILPSSFLP